MTAVRQRLEDGLLGRTLASLSAAGFDAPRLFVDGDRDGHEWTRLGCEVTFRCPAVRTFGAWWLAAVELYLREPHADRYAVFQDDMVACRNLRSYLEMSTYPERAYLNLFTDPSNTRDAVGWSESATLGDCVSQGGRGAVALVFSNEALRTLLSHKHFVDRPLDLDRGHRAVDGGIVTAMNKAGWREHIHNPSLVQHTGDVSSMGNMPHIPAPSFPGESFDATTLRGS